MTGIDVHQHLWPPLLVEQLRRRAEPPRLDGWRLLLPGSAPFDVDPLDHDVRARSSLDPDLSLTVVSLSAGLGVEYLDPADSTPLLDAWHEGVRGLPDRFAAWASTRLVDPDPAEVGALLKGSFVGLELPATAMSTPAAVEALAPLLQEVERADKPVLVHPGLVPGRPDRSGGSVSGGSVSGGSVSGGSVSGGSVSGGSFWGGSVSGGPVLPTDRLPVWWTPVVDYVGQLQAAWWAWAVAGRAVAPRLRICFAAAAGLAPVHHERLEARGGQLDAIDPLTFVDGSSYGPQALDAVIRVLGIDTVVLGSDRPYATARLPGLGPAADHAIRVANPARLLTGATSRPTGGTARS